MATHKDKDSMCYYHQDCTWYRCETNSCKRHPDKEISGDTSVAGSGCDDFILADDRLEALNRTISALKEIQITNSWVSERISGVLADVENLIWYKD